MLKIIFRSTILLFFAALGIGSVYYQDSFKFKHSPRGEGKGVVFFDRLRAEDGYNLMEFHGVLGPSYCAILNMEGKIVLTLPGTYCFVLPDGGYVAAYDGIGVEFRDSSLKVQWKAKTLPHHEVIVESESGLTYALTNIRAKHFKKKNNVEIDHITGFSREGNEVYFWDSAPHVKDFAASLKRMENSWKTSFGGWAYSHLNAINWIPSHRASSFGVHLPRGGFLVSDAAFWSLALIDRASGDVVWKFQDPDPRSTSLHTVRLLHSGNVLYFKNNMDAFDRERGEWFSEVVELDPRTNSQVWTYRAKETKTFYAEAHGSVERLTGGNTLISHMANGGGAFEVTPQGRVVWDWQNNATEPVIHGDIFRIRRLPKELVEKMIATAMSLQEPERADFFAF